MSDTKPLSTKAKSRSIPSVRTKPAKMVSAEDPVAATEEAAVVVLAAEPVEVPPELKAKSVPLELKAKSVPPDVVAQTALDVAAEFLELKVVPLLKVATPPSTRKAKDPLAVLVDPEEVVPVVLVATSLKVELNTEPTALRSTRTKEPTVAPLVSVDLLGTTTRPLTEPSLATIDLLTEEMDNAVSLEPPEPIAVEIVAAVAVAEAVEAAVAVVDAVEEVDLVPMALPERIALPEMIVPERIALPERIVPEMIAPEMSLISRTSTSSTEQKSRLI